MKPVRHMLFVAKPAHEKRKQKAIQGRPVHETGRLMNTESALRFMLRFFGTTSLLAIPFIFVPYSVMDNIHQQLQLGRLPEEPIVGYLARSLSAFYALVGALFWKISFNLPRYRSLLIYLGGALTLLGGAICFIDWWEGLPAVWKLCEGPFIIVAALVMLSLSRRIQAE